MRKGVVLLLILVVPTVVYLLLTTGKHHIKELQYYGEKIPGEKPGDTIYHVIPPFELTDQDGKPFGKVLQHQDADKQANMINQAKDLALLAQNMLKGEELTRFIRRSVALIDQE